jgi:hypothetical protein
MPEEWRRGREKRAEAPPAQEYEEGILLSFFFFLRELYSYFHHIFPPL